MFSKNALIILCVALYSIKKLYEYFQGNKSVRSVKISHRVWFIGLWLVLIEAGIFPHVKRGFYCDDRTISRKFRGDTISTGLMILTIPLMYPLLWISEAFFFVPVSLKSSRTSESANRAWVWFKEYLFGVILHLFIVDGLKVLFGELRPHFLDTCRPDALKSCRAGEYVSEYECTNDFEGLWFVRDASKSFPSGHSSTSFYEAIFFIWFLQRRAPRLRSKLLLPAIQSIILLYALLCSVSRITDNRHHWWDVVAGATIGMLFSVLTCIFLCKNFQSKRTVNVETIHQNGNGDIRHASVRRLISERTKDEVNLNNVVVP